MASYMNMGAAIDGEQDDPLPMLQLVEPAGGLGVLPADRQNHAI